MHTYIHSIYELSPPHTRTFDDRHCMLEFVFVIHADVQGMCVCGASMCVYGVRRMQQDRENKPERTTKKQENSMRHDET